MAGLISKLENLSRQLSLLGKPFTNNMLMAKILMTIIPVNYKHFYSALDSISNEDKTLKKRNQTFRPKSCDLNINNFDSWRLGSHR